MTEEKKDQKQRLWRRMTEEELLEKALDHVRAEYKRAVDLFPEFKSYHEGYAIILEELDELWHVIKGKENHLHAMEVESVHVAAMALRFIIDLVLSRSVRRDK